MPGVGLEDQRTLRVGGHILGVELALGHQRLHERVIHGELGEFAITQHITAGVTHMAQGQFPAVEHHGRQGGAHAITGGILTDTFSDGGVGLIGDHAHQCEHVIVARVGVQRPQMADHQLGGDLPGSVSTHSISQRQHEGPRIGGVLVVGTHQPAVRGHGKIKFQHQGTSLTVVRPIRISVPTSTPSGWSILRPPTKVPLRESRSSTNHSDPRLKIRACLPEA